MLQHPALLQEKQRFIAQQPVDREDECLCYADIITCRMTKGGTIEILLAERGSETTHAGEIMIAIGGGISRRDENVIAAARREHREELPGLVIEIEPGWFWVSGPAKYRYKWNSSERRAEKLHRMTDCRPAVSIVILAWLVSGDTQGSDEAVSPRWVSLPELLNTSFTYAFDQSLLLERLAKRFGL